MISIGSGIAALYPLAKQIIANNNEVTKIYTYFGFCSLAHVPLKQELKLLADHWNFECNLCLSQKSMLFLSNYLYENINLWW